MVRTTLFGTGLVTLALVVGAGVYTAGYTHGAAVPVAQPEGEPDMEAMMKMMMEAAAPGEQHAGLMKAKGDWNVHSEFSMGGMDAEGHGEFTAKSIIGGRFVLSHNVGDFMDTPFEGMAITGYDNIKGEYVGIWIDNFGTGVLYLTGQMERGSLVMTGTTLSPAGPHEMKIVTTYTDDNTMIDTFYDKPGEDWVQSGTVTYTRK